MKLAREVSVGTPTLNRAFPSLFSRSSPVVDRKSPLIITASLLRFHFIESAVMLVEKTRPMLVGDRIAFVGGYSALVTLFRARPEDSYKSLFGPSDRSATAMPPVKATSSLRDLLTTFQDGGFGFTAVTDGRMHAMVGLSDVLGLYQKQVIGTDFTVGDVASRVVEVSRQTPIRDVLKLMFERRIRRVFIRGTNDFVSDREIVTTVFSPRKLNEAKRSPRTLLDGPLLDYAPVESPEVAADMPLKEASRLVVQAQGGALVCRKGVVSPWDLVMKPFAKGHLNAR